MQKRADNAEQALAKATTEGKTDTDQVKQLQADAASTKKALHQMRIEAEADMEYRRQLDDRYRAALSRMSQLTQQRDSATAATQSVPGKIDAIEKQLEQVKKEKDDLAGKLQTTEQQLSKVTAERDDALAHVAKLQDAQKQIDKLVADNAALMTKLSEAEKTINQFKVEGEEKDKQIASLKQEVTSARAELAQARKESADFQRQMADLQSKLEESGKQLAAAKAENTTNAAENKKMVDENVIPRGIVLRQQKEEAVRAKTRKVVLEQLGDLEIHSKSLLKQIDFLSQPVVKLTEKERSLFKKPELQVTDSEISVNAAAEGATTGKPTAEQPPAPAPDNAVPAPKVADTTAPANATPVPAAPATEPAPAPSPTVAEATPAPPPATPARSKIADNGKKGSKTADKNKAPDQPALPTPDAPPALTLQQPPTQLTPVSRRRADTLSAFKAIVVHPEATAPQDTIASTSRAPQRPHGSSPPSASTEQVSRPIVPPAGG